MSGSDSFAASAILMVEPFSFLANPQTGVDNYFQRRQEAHLLSQRANIEWNALCNALTEAGISVLRFADHSTATPDALFPNNWFSTHPGGTLCLYPMKAPNRRLERRTEIIDFLRRHYPTVIDLSGHEIHQHFLEGTGSIVISHATQTAFAAVSARTNPELFRHWAALLGLKPVLFAAEDEYGRPIYHTNVCLSINSKLSFWVPDAIPDKKERTVLEKHLSGDKIIELSLWQMEAFCANVLMLQGSHGQAILACSTRAWEAYSPEQQNEIKAIALPVNVPIDTIEAHGGGGVRCMIAELW